MRRGIDIEYTLLSLCGAIEVGRGMWFLQVCKIRGLSARKRALRGRAAIFPETAREALYLVKRGLRIRN